MLGIPKLKTYAKSGPAIAIRHSITSTLKLLAIPLFYHLMLTCQGAKSAKGVKNASLKNLAFGT